jgi:hypothetical protein
MNCILKFLKNIFQFWIQSINISGATVLTKLFFVATYELANPWQAFPA